KTIFAAKNAITGNKTNPMKSNGFQSIQQTEKPNFRPRVKNNLKYPDQLSTRRVPMLAAPLSLPQ
ncbi:hypothetical protein PMAYCL1PPCAC_19566, partial [Pristionchus mayeri]